LVFLQITIRLGRALKKGEYRVKVYQLLVNDAEVTARDVLMYLHTHKVIRCCAISSLNSSL
jgi:hypothetical protein